MDIKTKKSMNAKRQWSDPEARDRITDAIRKSCKSPERSKKLSQLAKKRWADPEFRRKTSEAMRGENRSNWNPNRDQIIHRKGRGFQKAQRNRLLKESCEWCGSKDNLQLDHIIPVSAGGDSDDSNAQTLCVKCNNKKRITIDMELMKKWRENGGTPYDWDNTVPSWVRKSLEGVETKGRVVRRHGTPFLKIELECSWCGDLMMKQPNQLKRAKNNSYCSHQCRMNGLNSVVHDSNPHTSAPPERDDIVRATQ
jgi:5-methylcytosine-specific restriction enzyme A